MRDCGPTEVGGFGISAEAAPLLVEDFVLVRQRCTAVSVQFDDAAVADYFDQQVDRGLSPERFARIWIHTHPGTSAEPSGVDEQTFQRSFRQPDWAVMAILACGGATYGRLRFNTGPGGDQRLDLGVDFAAGFPGSDPGLWTAEYAACVTEHRPDLGELMQAAVGGSAADLTLPNRREHSELCDPTSRKEVLYLA